MNWNTYHGECDRFTRANPSPAAAQDEDIAQMTNLSSVRSGLRQSITGLFSLPRFNSPRTRNQVKILFLSANPVDVVTLLRSEIEHREINQKIQLGRYRDHLILIPKFALRTSDLSQVLLEHQPDIVHFSGHGKQNGELFLEDEAGKRKAVSLQAFADLFRLHNDHIRLVVLNACYAKEQAKILSQTIEFTIGMNDTIDDKAAIVFASEFYMTLAFGRPVKQAFDNAVARLRIEGFPDAASPELYERESEAAARFRFVQPRVTAFGKWLLVSLALLLALDILRRFPGSDGVWWDMVTTWAQPLLIPAATMVVALVAASVLRLVSPLVEKTTRFTLFDEPQKNRRAVIFMTSVLALAFGLWLCLPIFARYCNEEGFKLQYREPPDPTRAREAYQLAVRLKPNYMQAHYNLATLHEGVEPEKAMEEYLLAIRCDGRMYPAYNNLARLYLRRGKANDYESALSLLNQASDFALPDEDVQYSLNKNLGWANYALGHYALAETYLRRAIALRDDQNAAAAHCLMALVLKAQGKTGVSDECFDCVSQAPGAIDIEANWLSEAQECLLKGERR
jgi:tetratricopeptide (TPR) repeat protein